MRNRTLIFIVFMIISPIILCSKSIKILYPNGGEVLLTNSSVLIKWTAEETTGKVVIALLPFLKVPKIQELFYGSSPKILQKGKTTD